MTQRSTGEQPDGAGHRDHRHRRDRPVHLTVVDNGAGGDRVSVTVNGRTAAGTLSSGNITVS